MRIAVPLYFLTDGILGEHRQKLFSHPEGWIDYYGNVMPSGPAIDTILQSQHCFLMHTEDGDEPNPQNSCATMIFYSLSFRYFDRTEQPQYSSDEYITWNYKFKKMSDGSQAPTKNTPFTVLTIADKNGSIQKNIIYGPTGEIIYCIDFDQPRNFKHPKGDGHFYPHDSIPWVWLAVSFDPQMELPVFKSDAMAAYPYELMEIHIDPAHVNPEFKWVNLFGVDKYMDFTSLIESVHGREEARKAKTPQNPSALSSLYATARSYAPYLATLGLFVEGYKACQRFEVYEGLKGILPKGFK